MRNLPSMGTNFSLFQILLRCKMKFLTPMVNFSTTPRPSQYYYPSYAYVRAGLTVTLLSVPCEHRN
jgi:hypothetical protein